MVHDISRSILTYVFYTSSWYTHTYTHTANTTLYILYTIYIYIYIYIYTDLCVPGCTHILARSAFQTGSSL